MFSKYLSWNSTKVLGAAASVAALSWPGAAQAEEAITCTDSFSNNFALTNVRASARDTFAYSTGFNAQGKLDYCSNAPSGVCWTYRHRCSSYYINVVDLSGFGHFHLSFTDPSYLHVPGCFVDPGDGYGFGFAQFINGACSHAIPNWTTLARHANGHFGTQWIGFTMADSSGAARVFDMPRIHVGGTRAIQLWFHSVVDGNWYVWSSLAANTNWYVAALVNTDQVELTGVGTAQDPVWEIDDFDLTER